MTVTAPARRIATAESKPLLPRHVRLRFDPVREKYAVLAPEKLFWPDDVSVAILQLCDGSRSVGAIADTLAAEYNAPQGVILEDVLEFVQEWSDTLLLKI
jgi:pyrroloquinoline quinone biosynthesis protein D